MINNPNKLRDFARKWVLNPGDINEGQAFLDQALSNIYQYNINTPAEETESKLLQFFKFYSYPINELI